MKKQILALSLAVGALLPINQTFAASPPTNIQAVVKNPFLTVAGQGLEPTKFEDLAISYQDTTYLPLRRIAENLGAAVGWQAATSTITVTNQNLFEPVTRDFTRELSSWHPQASDLGSRQLSVSFTDINFEINGRKLQPATPPFIYQGTTYVPLRFVGEALGQNVAWSNSNPSGGELQSAPFQVTGESIWIGVPETAVSDGDLNTAKGQITKVVEEFVYREHSFDATQPRLQQLNSLLSPDLTRDITEYRLDKFPSYQAALAGNFRSLVSELVIEDISFPQGVNDADVIANVSGYFTVNKTFKDLPSTQTTDFVFTLAPTNSTPIIVGIKLMPREIE